MTLEQKYLRAKVGDLFSLYRHLHTFNDLFQASLNFVGGLNEMGIHRGSIQPRGRNT